MGFLATHEQIKALMGRDGFDPDASEMRGANVQWYTFTVNRDVMSTPAICVGWRRKVTAPVFSAMIALQLNGGSTYYVLYRNVVHLFPHVKVNDTTPIALCDASEAQEILEVLMPPTVPQAAKYPDVWHPGNE